MKSLLRLGAVSLFTTLLEYGLYLGLVAHVGVPYVVASIVVGGLGLLVSFTLGRRWAFGSRAPEVFAQLLRHCLVSGAGVLLGAGVLALLVEQLGLSYRLGWAVQNLAVFFVWTYPASRHLVFREGAAGGAQPAHVAGEQQR